MTKRTICLRSPKLNLTSTAQVELGDLILVFGKWRSRRQIPLLGVYKDVIQAERCWWLCHPRDYLSFEGDPVKFKSVQLPIGHTFPTFVPARLDYRNISPSKLRDVPEYKLREIKGDPCSRIAEHPYLFCLDSILEIYSGKRAIVKKLASDPGKRFGLHIPIVESLERPYPASILLIKEKFTPSYLQSS